MIGLLSGWGLMSRGYLVKLPSGDIWHSPDHGRAWRKLPFNLGAVWRTLVVLDR